ncbi:YceI family protein [Antrihabitans sp. YC2-6]|uniref:YceI family protein n=1 Tax=Antrihabitans sp. YC2-6 TaxID=2799498 RepID=UPI0018F581FA|nr:YceI family protein [Antrihabitans sp. YC2-6]MBJ8343790.1 YceI family protein [Antrihabitans sp. YC2-6]
MTLSQNAVTTMRVDTTQSTASFAVKKLGFTVKGTVPIRDGRVELDESGAIIAISGVADLSAIDTGNKRRDIDLRKKNLLDLDAHPAACFEAKTVWPTEDGLRVSGRLDARGASAKVVFNVVREGNVFHGTCVFDRRELGVRAPRILIGHDITMTITAALVREN